VSFAWPLLPVLFIAVGLWMTVYGVTLEPLVSAAAALTIVAGALVYHFRIRKAEPHRASLARDVR
jgi:hypothetical protein